MFVSPGWTLGESESSVRGPVSHTLTYSHTFTYSYTVTLTYTAHTQTRTYTFATYTHSYTCRTLSHTHTVHTQVTYRSDTHTHIGAHSRTHRHTPYTHTDMHTHLPMLHTCYVCTNMLTHVPTHTHFSLFLPVLRWEGRKRFLRLQWLVEGTRTSSSSTPLTTRVLSTPAPESLESPLKLCLWSNSCSSFSFGSGKTSHVTSPLSPYFPNPYLS